MEQKVGARQEAVEHGPEDGRLAAAVLGVQQNALEKEGSKSDFLCKVVFNSTPSTEV